MVTKKFLKKIGLIKDVPDRGLLTVKEKYMIATPTESTINDLQKRIDYVVEINTLLLEKLGYEVVTTYNPNRFRKTLKKVSKHPKQTEKEGAANDNQTRCKK